MSGRQEVPGTLGFVAEPGSLQLGVSVERGSLVSGNVANADAGQ